MWCPKGHDFEKNRINFLFMPAQATGHKILDLETLSKFFENQANEKTNFL